MPKKDSAGPDAVRERHAEWSREQIKDAQYADVMQEDDLGARLNAVLEVMRKEAMTEEVWNDLQGLEARLDAGGFKTLQGLEARLDAGGFKTLTGRNLDAEVRRLMRGLGALRRRAAFMKLAVLNARREANVCNSAWIDAWDRLLALVNGS